MDGERRREGGGGGAGVGVGVGAGAHAADDGYGEVVQVVLGHIFGDFEDRFAVVEDDVWFVVVVVAVAAGQVRSGIILGECVAQDDQAGEGGNGREERLHFCFCFCSCFLMDG